MENVFFKLQPSHYTVEKFAGILSRALRSAASFVKDFKLQQWIEGRNSLRMISCGPSSKLQRRDGSVHRKGG